MDEEQFAALREWGEGLILDDRAEVRAAGKAILLLCAEVERLEIALWNARHPPVELETPSAEDDLQVTDELGPAQELLGRVRRFLRAPFAR
jgi:hypothetical protein